MAIYNPKSLKAEEFINDGEVMINAMLKAVNDKSEDYTLDWIYENVAPKK